MIKKTLYHLTDQDSASRVLKEGFSNGEDGLVWLCEHPTQVLGEASSQRILKVIINIEPDELRSYEYEGEEEEYKDSKTGEWVPISESNPEYEGKFYYAIPADRLNEIGSIVLVPLSEQAQLKR